MKLTKCFKIALAAACVVIGLSAGAQNFQSANFINGFNFQLNSQSTNSFNTSGIYAKSVIVTNTAVTITNSANGLIINGYVSSFLPVYVTNSAGFSDCDMWEDRDGTVPAANIAVDVNSGNPLFTNTVTFNFASIAYSVGSGVTGSGISALPSTAAQNLFSFSVTANGTNDVVVATNLPAGFMTGIRKIRLLNIAVTSSGTTIGTNGVVAGVWLSGYHPVGSM